MRGVKRPWAAITKVVAAAVATSLVACGAPEADIAATPQRTTRPSARVDSPAIPATAASAVTSAESTPTANADGDETSPPLRTNAKSTYRSRVLHALRGRWEERCAEGATASGTVTFADFRVTSVSDPSLEVLMGAPIPRTPENFPDVAVESVSLRFVCPKKATTE